ncbi:hypothetical protein DM793_03095 [Paenarthrobacter nitroguajacolicus]|nr:hypothetical protein [Paenarthrobacter nitroguajacolicus]
MPIWIALSCKLSAGFRQDPLTLIRDADRPIQSRTTRALVWIVSHHQRIDAAQDRFYDTVIFDIWH